MKNLAFKSTIGLLLIMAITLMSCEKEDTKPDWEITYATWELDNIIQTTAPRYWLHLKVKNNTSTTMTYFGIYVNLVSGDGTIKKRGLYVTPYDIVPKQELDIERNLSGITFLTQAEFDNLKNLKLTYDEPTIVYK